MTRWREDSVRDAWGSFTYLHDVVSGATWLLYQALACRMWARSGYYQSGLGVDGVDLDGLVIPLLDGRREHNVEARVKAR